MTDDQANTDAQVRDQLNQVKYYLQQAMDAADYLLAQPELYLDDQYQTLNVTAQNGTALARSATDAFTAVYVPIQ